MIKRSFIKESLLYTIGNSLPMLASIILLPFYVNYLSTTNYVALSFYLGINLLFQIIFSLSFEQYYGVVYTEVKQHAQQLKLLNGSIFMYILLQASVIIAIMSIIGSNIFTTIFQKEIPVKFYPYGLMSILIGLFNALFRVSISPFIYMSRSKVYFTSNFVLFLSTLIFPLSGLFLFPDTFIGPMYGRLFSAIIAVLFNYYILKSNIEWKLEWHYIIEIIKKSWALFASSLLLWITANIDRYFLKNYVPINELASYDLMMKCFIGIEFIQNGLSITIISKIFDRWKKNEGVQFTEQTNKYIHTFILLNTAAILAFILFIPNFIEWIVSNNQYYTTFQLIGMIAVSYILRVLYYPYYFAMLYAKKTPQLFLINLIMIVLQIILSYYFIPIYGLMAAIFIQIFIRILIPIIYHTYIRQIVQQIKINYIKWFGIPFWMSICMIALHYYPTSVYWIDALIFILIFVIISFFAYKNEAKLVYLEYYKNRFKNKQR